MAATARRSQRRTPYCRSARRRAPSPRAQSGHAAGSRIDVRKPRATSLRALQTGTMLDDDGLLPSRPRARREVRRVVLLGRAHDGHLLPAELPGADAAPPQHRVPPDRRGRGPCGVPRLPSVPPGHDAGLAGVEPRRRRRRAGGPRDQRRRRRPRGDPRPRRSPRLLGTPAAPRAHDVARRRVRSSSPGRTARRRRGRCSRRRSCPSPRSPSRPGSARHGSSTTRSATSSRARPPRCATRVARRRRARRARSSPCASPCARPTRRVLCSASSLREPWRAWRPATPPPTPARWRSRMRPACSPSTPRRRTRRG